MNSKNYFENSIFLNKGDYLNFEKFCKNKITKLEFTKIPSHYSVNGQIYYEVC